MAYIGLKEKFSPDKLSRFCKSKSWRIELSAPRSRFFYKGREISHLLYKEEIDHEASLLSSKSAFRKALIPIQRSFYSSKAKKGLILEGRDCGTVIFPLAPLKVFLAAGEETRAKRRARDRKQPKGEVFKAQKKRDERDKNRSFAPLIQAEDAIFLDSEKNGIEELTETVYQQALKVFSL